MRIQCLITRSFLSRYVDEELGERFVLFIQNHVEGCERCRAQVGRLALARRRLRESQPPAVTGEEWEELWSGVLQRVEEEEGRIPLGDGGPFQRQHTRVRYVLLAAAVAVLVVGAALRLLVADNQPQQASITSYIQYHEDAVDGHVLLENQFVSTQILPVSYTAGR